jgi:hypothetical protein
MLQALPDTLTSDQCKVLAEINRAPLPELAKISDKAFAEVMKLLDTLKRKAVDDDSAALFYRVYERGIRHLPAKQIWWTVDKVIETLTFFPTVAEFLKIAERWQRADDAVLVKREASRLLNRERIRLLTAPRFAPPPITQDAVDAMDEKMKSIGIACGALIERDGKVTPNLEPVGAKHEAS